MPGFCNTAEPAAPLRGTASASTPVFPSAGRPAISFPGSGTTTMTFLADCVSDSGLEGSVRLLAVSS